MDNPPPNECPAIRIFLVPFIFPISLSIWFCSDSVYLLNKVNSSNDLKGIVNIQLKTVEFNDSNWLNDIVFNNVNIAELQNISISTHQSNFLLNLE